VIGLVVGRLATELEEVVVEKKYTYCGGLQLESDVRQLFKYFSALSAKSIRDKLARLRDMASFLAVEKLADILELWRAEENDNDPNSIALAAMDTPQSRPAQPQPQPQPQPQLQSQSPAPKSAKWRISPTELKTLLTRRSDLNQTAIARLQLT